jgi:hypothetical protein
MATSATSQNRKKKTLMLITKEKELNFGGPTTN